VRLGDDEALAEIFHAHAPALAKFAERYVRDAAVAEELVQDAFLWIVRNRATWSVRGTIRAYLYGAVRNYALDHLRHRSVEQRWARAGDPAPEVVPDESDRLVTDERAAMLVRAIAQLAESRRTALTLRRVQGLSYAEIAAVLGSSTKAVENQLNRTLRQLRELLGE
jgi:RNA polymerase sigma-70 factor (ECF subfamily)